MEEHKITASFGLLSEQAFSQSAINFNKSIEIIDKEFGEGYSKEHPELIAAFLQASATEYAGISITVGLQNIAETTEKLENLGYLFEISERI